MTSLRARKPTASELGLHRLFGLLLLLNAGVAALTVPFYGRFGLELDWATFLPSVAAVAFAAIGWLAHRSTPGRPSEWPIAESFAAFTLIAISFSVVTPAQYLAVALNRPLVDPWLARADALMGISVPAAVEWTRTHPHVTSILQLSYYSLAPQFVAPIVVLGLYYRERQALWEYTFNFHVCLAITLGGLALFPAACAFTYYGFDSLIDQSRFIQHFNAVRSGTFTTLQLRELEGLITFPSFHVAGALMVTWAFRRHRVLFVGFAVLNSLLIASTVLLGPHYAIDILASLAVFLVSTFVYSRWAHLLTTSRKTGRRAEPHADDELLRAG